MFNFVKHCFYYLSGLEKYIFNGMRWGRKREGEEWKEKGKIRKDGGREGKEGSSEWEGRERDRRNEGEEGNDRETAKRTGGD